MERFLAETDERYTNLCLDTGHFAYYGGDNLALIRRHPSRIGFLHLKQVDHGLLFDVLKNDVPFATAVGQGIMIEPPNGVPELAPIIEAVADIDPRDPRDRRAGPLSRSTRTCRCRSRHGRGSTSSRRRRAHGCRLIADGGGGSMAGRDLRVAVVGAGMMGGDHVARIAQRISGATVAAIVEPDPDRAAAAAANAPGASVRDRHP